MPYSEYITKPNDVLDAVCYAHYGVEGNTETVLVANPSIADYGTHLPEGVVIRLPALQVSAPLVAQVVSLWD
jgi:phage tail protein X